MRRRHLPPRPLPRRWLMTDERIGAALWDALERLPRGSGVVFRHHATPPAERQRLFARVRRIARRRGLVLVRAGATALRGEDGAHNQRRRTRGLRTFAVHDVRQAIAARRADADLVFVSPVFATRSHPGTRGLGVVRLGLLLRHVAMPAVVLGGMSAGTFRRLDGLKPHDGRKLHGWAGIDVWMAPDAAKPRRQTTLCEAGRAGSRDAL